MRSRTLLLAPIALAAGLAGSAVPAHASLLLDRDTHYESLKVAYIGGQQVAEVTYSRSGSWHHVLVWGAIDARRPSPTIPQIKFKVNYSGGYGSFAWGRNTWSYIANHNVCTNHASLGLQLVVTQCTVASGAGKGQHWALQAWQRELPNMGISPTSSAEAAWELHVSHWNGSPAKLWLKWDWYAKNDPLPHGYGALGYQGYPVFGYLNTPTGNQLDGYGRNIYVDIQTTHWGWAINKTPAYSQADHWYRFNAFLTHQSRGDFCTTVFSKFPWESATRDPYGATGFRATAVGPGVSPDVRWSGPAPTGSSTPYAPGFANGGYLYGAAVAPLVQPLLTTTETNLWRSLDDEQIQIASGSNPTDKCATVYGPK